MTTITKKRDYLRMLDILPALALGQLCSKWLLTVFHGSPEATSWIAALSLAVGGGVGFVLSKFMRTKVTENMQNRRTAFIVSLSVSLVFALAIVTTTVLLTKPREISYEEATSATHVELKPDGPIYSPSGEIIPDGPIVAPQPPKPRGIDQNAVMPDTPRDAGASLFNLTVIAVAATPDDERNYGLEGGRLRSRNFLAARPRNLT